MSECMTQEDAMNMSNEQAVAILKPLMNMMRDQNGCPISDVYFAVGKAIEALSQPQRIKGRWTKAYDGYDGHVKCTQCFKTYDWDAQAQYYNFCPNCGADMRTKETDYDYERAVEQLEHDILYEPTFNQDDGSM